ncbi:MAG: hypothetical protein V3S24_06870, partial [Candidatus Tectomicrobia bacterium]
VAVCRRETGTPAPADVAALQWCPVSQKITREDNKKMLGGQRVGWWQHAVPWRSRPLFTGARLTCCRV